VKIHAISNAFDKIPLVFPNQAAYTPDMSGWWVCRQTEYPVFGLI
jgi:hypothetical protein